MASAMHIIKLLSEKTDTTASEYNYIPDKKNYMLMSDLYFRGFLCPEKYDPMIGLDFFIEKTSQWILEIKGV